MPGSRLLVLLATLLLAGQAWAGTVLVDFLDVGQGDSILVRGGGKAVLIDAGDPDAGVLEQLQVLGVSRLDLVVTTHAHSDHVGCTETILRALPVGLYMDHGMPHGDEIYDDVLRAVEELDIPYQIAQKGMKIRLGDEASFTVLHPRERLLFGTRSDQNANSVVLLLEHDEVSFLFTGDAEEPTERLIIPQIVDPVTVLKVPHHGGGYSTTMPLLRRTRPEYAVISVGADNRYGHPRLETMLRLRAIDAMVFRTDTSGHVRAVSDGKTVDVLEGTLAELGPGPVERDRSGQDELVLSGPDPGYDRAVRKKRKARKKGRGKDVLERRPSRGAEDQPWR